MRILTFSSRLILVVFHLCVGSLRALKPTKGTKQLTMQPHAQSREKLVRIDWFRQIFRCAGLETLFAVALHGLSREGDNGKTTKSRVLSNHLHSFIAIHFRHHDIHQSDGYVWRGVKNGNGFPPCASG